jgi:hypothetical protein
MCKKYFYLTIVFTFFTIILFLLTCTKKEKLTIDTFQEIKQNFVEPPVEFRSVPFAVWNDEVTEEKIDRQINEMHSQGIGGIFVHPRYGMITPYFSDKYFSLYKYTYEKVKSLGMKMWIYDENGYPSGGAGGYVREEMLESAGKALVFHYYDVLPSDIKGEVVVVLKSENSNFIDITNRLEEEKSKTGKYYVFELVKNTANDYVDLLMKGVTEKFLEITLEKGYKKYFGQEFGKMILGIFQDEADISSPVANSLKWTPDLFTAFQKKWGYDLKLHLPSLIGEVGNWKKIRHNYYSVLLDLFIERWAKVYYNYCEKNNLKFTGHYWENWWPNPARSPDNMAMYEWQHMPGIDILDNTYNDDSRLQRLEAQKLKFGYPFLQFGNVRVVKELSSVANQMGRNRTLSETYGRSGWELRFEDMKRIGDWEYALGVNFLNQHLFQMTLKGKRKQDNPPSFYHGPYWKFYKVLADYFARLSLVLSSGKQINKILVIEPTSSVWMYYSTISMNIRNKEPGDEYKEIIAKITPNQRNLELGDSFQEFITKLSKLQVEYDLGCENIIKNNGKIKNGKFVVGESDYGILVLPPGLENLNSSTVALIEKYIREGGKVISFVETPKYVDGAESDKVSSIVSKYEKNWIKLNQLDAQVAVDLFASKDFSIPNPENISGILHHHRRYLNDGEILFLVNTSDKENASGIAKVKGKSALQLNLLNGNITQYPAKKEGNLLSIDFDLPPVGSLLLFVSSFSSPLEKVYTTPEDTLSEKLLKPIGNLQIYRIKPNALTIDYCDIKLEGKVEKDLYSNFAQRNVYQHYGFRRNPWYGSYQFKTEILDKDKFPKDSGFEATYYFQVDKDVNKTTLKAVVEQPEIFNVYVNDNKVEPISGEFWLDPAFAVFDIGRYVVNGTNLITLKVSPFTILAELENIYILGDFNLRSQAKGWRLIKPSKLSIGEWNKQGIPFYSDGVAYSKTYDITSKDKKYFVKLSKWLGTVAEVQVNKEFAGIISWPPHRLDISDKIKNGKNEITIIVYGSLKNLLGPHHNPVRGRTGPSSWDVAPEKQPSGEKYDFIGYGLFEDFSVIEK